MTHLTRRALVAPVAPVAPVYNEAAKKPLPFTLPAPQAAWQGLDIGSTNGQFAFIWSDGNPRIVKWDAKKRVVKTQWLLLRKHYLPKVGCNLFDVRWLNTSQITVKCGKTLLLATNVSSGTGAGQVKARSVTIDNFGTVRFYGQKDSKSVVVLVLKPDFEDYTGKPAANNLKVFRPA